jgi:hypothetical protein
MKLISWRKRRLVWCEQLILACDPPQPQPNRPGNLLLIKDLALAASVWRQVAQQCTPTASMATGRFLPDYLGDTF